MKAIDLRAEYLHTPLGLGIAKPRFYWNCEGGKVQSAYRILCRKEEQVIWDSGKVLSASMTHIRYEGEILASRDRVAWSVQLWDEQDKSGEMSESWFEMGLLDASD